MQSSGTRAGRLTALALASAVAGVSALACEDETPPDPGAEAAASQGAETRGVADDEAIGRARSAAKALGGQLKRRLVAAMGEGGPSVAISVCAEEAQAIGERVAEARDVRVGRSSLRLRNPENEGPPWVEGWLTEQGERSAEGVSGFARVEEGEARVLVPIATEALCVNCHGPRESIAPEVREVLEARYPEDRAVGYEEGDLRGALWAAVEVPDS